MWERLRAALGEVSAQTVASLDAEALRGMGMSLRKGGYILDFARRVRTGAFDIEAVRRMDDQQAVAALTALKGVGVWTAEMILLFCLERMDVLSYGDLAIRRGLRMLYRHKTLDRERFERYRRRYSPMAGRGEPLPVGGGLRRDRGVDRPRRGSARLRGKEKEGAPARTIKAPRAGAHDKTAFELCPHESGFRVRRICLFQPTGKRPLPRRQTR